MNKEGVRVVAKLTARPEKAPELASVLLALIGPTRKEKGCVSYELLRHKTDASEFRFCRGMDERSALDAHLATPHYETLSRRPSLMLAADPMSADTSYSDKNERLSWTEKECALQQRNRSHHSPHNHHRSSALERPPWYAPHDCQRNFSAHGKLQISRRLQCGFDVPQKLLITASSGNFGQALAYACSLLRKSCIVVMPANSAKVKVDAVREFGGQVEMVDVRVKSRQDRVAELAGEHPDAYVASSHDDPLVIQGNSSLGHEIAALSPAPEIVVAPIGGGGLAAGIILGLEQSPTKIRVIAAEPLAANDAARSLQAGEIVSNPAEPETIADGARNIRLGKHNWEILKARLDRRSRSSRRNHPPRDAAPIRFGQPESRTHRRAQHCSPDDAP